MVPNHDRPHQSNPVVPRHSSRPNLESTENRKTRGVGGLVLQENLPGRGTELENEAVLPPVRCEGRLIASELRELRACARSEPGPTNEEVHDSGFGSRRGKVTPSPNTLAVERECWERGATCLGVRVVGREKGGDARAFILDSNLDWSPSLAWGRALLCCFFPTSV